MEGCRLRIADSNVQAAGTLLRGRVAVEVANETADRRLFDVTLRTPTRWMETRQITLLGREHKTVEFPLEMSLGEEREIKVEATDPATKMAVALDHILTPIPPLKIAFNRSYYTDETTASLLVESLQDPTEEHTLDLKLYNADTGRAVWQPEPTDIRRFPGSPDDAFLRSIVHVPLNRLPLGGYLMEAVLGDPSAGQRSRVWSALRRLAPRKGEVKTHAGGFLLRNGAPFFPVEVRRVQPTVAVNAEIKSKAAFNVNWAWYFLDADGTDSYMRNFYNDTGCLGEVCVDHLAQAQGEARDAAIARIRRIAASPFTVAYGMEWLPDEDGYSTEPMATIRSYLQTLDPHRAFYVVLSHPAQVERYRGCADFLVMRCRTIGPDGVGEPAWAYDQIRRAREQAGPTVPIVAMLSAYRDYEQGLERPNPEQMRAMTYMALIGGAAGVIFDGYHYRSSNDPAKRGFSDDPALRDMIYALSRQLAVLGPILISPSEAGGAEVLPVAVEQPPSGPVRSAIRPYGSELYVVAANGSAQRAVAALHLKQEGGGAMVVREVSSTRAEALGPRIPLEFEPYEVRVFAISIKR
jgi:hypothetical protein